MTLVIGGALALGIYPAGWLSDRIGRKPLVMAGALGAAVSAISLLWADDATDVLVIASFLGAFLGVLLSSNWALANDLGTTGQEGLHMGIVNLATTGGAASSKLMGPGIDLLNRISEGSGYSALLITCGLLFVVGALLLMPLRVDSRDTLSPYPREMR
jgi:MFS family permease